MGEHWRQRAARGLGRYFERRRWPRISLGLVVVLTGLAGFGISSGLLRLGMHEMWLRYPLAVLGAYGVFLGLLRIWVEIERAHFQPDDPELLAAIKEEEPEPVRPLPSSGRSWFDWLDVPDLDFGGESLEGCAVGIFVASAVGLLAILVAVVAGAPVLVAEVAVDVFLVSVLYRRLKAAEREHWLGAAVRRTGWHALGVAVLLMLIGGSLAVLAPEADSLGEAIRQWKAGR